MVQTLRREDYTVGWICALAVELAAAQEMLDEQHQRPQTDSTDTNSYKCGRIGTHNVVIACLPGGTIAPNSSTEVAVRMKYSFPNIRFGFLVGIGGGVPTQEDIRLGDVVVSKPLSSHGGVVQFEHGRTTKTIAHLGNPPTILLSALSNMRANHMRGKNNLIGSVLKLQRIQAFSRAAAGPDVLFKPDYKHEGGQGCTGCSKNAVVQRKSRQQDVMVHYGTIASSNRPVRDSADRNKISADLGGVLCFESESAGVLNYFPCLVIRGICDYADSHANGQWRAYAAATSAACAKEVLSVI
ncbi:unnamed protein product [Periconia digitata]|uniref:Nucleoside phosphorylase domain-containing protein n=1 Tax=Periconia digitata TaxID=1303443 RepID=A0A9W4XUQ9_9PLEO|nr:unnamed protein product [Periconia digitata]